MHVLDASAIAVLLRRFREKSPELLEGRVTLDLALYELSNLIWKECALEKRVGREQAISMVGGLCSVLNTMIMEKIASSGDLKGVMKLAVELNLTFYDSSYLYLAKTRRAILVTEDDELARRARQANVKTERVDEYVESG